MVGLAGALGDFDENLSTLSETLCFFGDESVSEFQEGDTFVTSVFHDANRETQPVRVESTGELLWVWGEVYGYLDVTGEYTSRRDDVASDTKSEYCASLYEEYGLDFIKGLNGSFSGVILNEEVDSIQFFTDRLGTRPIHYTVVDEGVVFSTQIQAIATLLSDKLSFDLDYVAEFFAFERSFGRKTPIEGVERAHPGAITRIDLRDRSVETDVKWRPKHEPLDRGFDYFVDEFASTFESAVFERYDSDAKTGVLMSGGSDSRLIVGALPKEGVTGYHINDWKNREAKIAERVAEVTGKSFVYLERDEEFFARSLDFNTQVSNYISWFDHGHVGGYVDLLREECDVLMTGHYSDTLFKRTYLPYKGLPLSKLNIELPLFVEEPVNTIDDLIELYLGSTFHNRKQSGSLPKYLRLDTDLPTILEHNIKEVDGYVDHHGVTHHSPRDAALFSESYPVTNTAGRLFFDVMLQASPFRNPFLDVRLIELMTKLPIKYRLRKNVINASIEQIHPELAELPHPGTNIAIKRPFVLQYLAIYATWILDKFRDDNKPKPYFSHGSWTNHSELIRHHNLFEAFYNEWDNHTPIPNWIDQQKASTDYSRHVSGEDRFAEVYAAVSFFSVPTSKLILGDAKISE